MNISTKILLYTLTTAFFTFLIGIGIIGFDAKEQGIKDAKELIDSYVRENANLTSIEIHKDIMVTRALTSSLSAIKEYPYHKLIETQNKIFREMLKNNPTIISTWVSWELGFIQTGYTKNYGRKRFIFSRNADKINFTEEDLDLDGDNIRGLYYRAKLNKNEDVTNPYAYSYNKLDSILEVSIWNPLLYNNQFVGLAGIDVSLERYESILSKIQPYENSKAILFANNGSVIAGGRSQYVSLRIEDIFPDIDKTFDIQEKIRKGDFFSIEGVEKENEYYIAFAPIWVGKSDKPWALAIVVPTKSLSEQANQRLFFAFFIGVIGLAILALVITFIATYISRPLKEMSRKLHNLEKGVFHVEDKLTVSSSDEIGEVARSVNKLIDTLNNTAQFANDIGQGKLDTSYELLSTEDTLGKALLEMRSNLLHARLDEEQRKQQEYQQNWIQKGIADSGIILRQGVDNLEEFGHNIISFLVKFVEANQGGFFVLDDFNPEDKHLQLVAAYAFDKRRIRNKRVEMSEGLISRAVHEQEMIYLTNIPENYFKITSGFGEKLPTSLIIMPLVFENLVYGVIEIASFEEMPPFQVQFLEQVSERIGAFLANLKKSIRTNILLEDSQRQAEELINNEKKFREQFEKLQKEHIELFDQFGNIEKIFSTIDSSVGIAYFSPNGIFEDVNEKYLDMYFTNRTNIIGAQHLKISLVAQEDSVKNEYFWSNLKKGIAQKRTERIVHDENTFYIEEIYIPIFNTNNSFERIISLGWEITEHVSKENKLRDIARKLKQKVEQQKG